MKVHKNWAFANQATLYQNENNENYNKIKHLKSKEHISYNKSPQYAHTTFIGTLISDEAKVLTADELLLLMDDGNLCFGGDCCKRGDKFCGSYNTD